MKSIILCLIVLGNVQAALAVQFDLFRVQDFSIPLVITGGSAGFRVTTQPGKGASSYTGIPFKSLMFVDDLGSAATTAQQDLFKKCEEVFRIAVTTTVGGRIVDTRTSVSDWSVTNYNGTIKLSELSSCELIGH